MKIRDKSEKEPEFFLEANEDDGEIDLVCDTGGDQWYVLSLREVDGKIGFVRHAGLASKVFATNPNDEIIEFVK